MIKKEVKLEILYAEIKGEERETGILDIYKSDNLPLSIQYGIKNVQSLNESKGSYTKTFDIPATKHNNKLLKHALKDGLADITVFVDQSIKCRIRVNGQVVLTGSFTIKAYQKGAKEQGYTITVLGDNNNWTAIMDGKMMCETVVPNLNGVHQWTDGLWNWYNDNVKVDDINFPSGGLPTYSVCIPHICWGEYEYDHTPSTWKKMHLMDNTPSFFIKNLVYAFFNEAGYTVVSKFMGTKFFKKLIIPTDPSRFNHGNIGTLGGGTGTTEIVVAEAEFFNDTGQGVGVEAYHTIGSPSFQAPNFSTDASYDPSMTAATSNHWKPLGWVKYGSYNPKWYQWWQDRLAPFNVEITDLYNVQDLYTHQTTIEPLWQDNWKHKSTGAPHVNGMAQDSFMYTKKPTEWHRWVCPITAEYTIDIELSVGCWKQYVAVSNGRAKCQLRLLMVENASGWNDNDNSSNNTYASGLGTSTVLETDTQSTPSSAQHRTYTYKELNLNWTGIIPAGAHIVVEVRTRNEVSTDWESHSIILDHEFTKWDAGWEMVGMTGLKARRSFFRITTGNTINRGDDVTWSNYLPCDITQKKFISGLTGMFNLYWYTDEQSKTVYCEPYEDFYQSKGDSVNWKDKLDVSKAHQTKFLTDVIARNALYRYQPPSKDGFQETINEDLVYPYASQFVDLGAQYLDETQEYGTSLFVPTIMINDNQLVELIDPNAPWIPLIVKEYVEDIESFDKPEKGEGFGLRILSYEGLQSTGSQDVFITTKTLSGGSGLGQTYPRAVSYCKGSVPQSGQEHANLQYHDVDNSGTQDGLFTTYYDTMFQDLIQLPRMKIALFHLTPSDISQLDLRRLVYITEDGGANGTYWKIHKIVDYKPHHDGLTKVELLQYQIKDTSRPRLATGGTTGGNDGPTDDGGIGVGITGTTGVHTTGSKDVRAVFLAGGENDPMPLTRPITGKSFVMKANNKAPKNNGNIVLGNGLTTRLQNQIVLGRFNKQDDDAILVIGGGLDENNRRNVLTVKNDGSIHLGGDSTNLVTKDGTGAYIDLYTEDKDEYDNLTINKVR